MASPLSLINFALPKRGFPETSKELKKVRLETPMFRIPCDIYYPFIKNGIIFVQLNKVKTI